MNKDIYFKKWHIKFFADNRELDYCLYPSIMFDFGRIYDNHNIFMIQLRFLKMNCGFTIFWNFKP